MRNFITALVLSCILSTPVLAHRVVASAWMDGRDIEGEVGFSNGDMAADGTLVEVFDLAGEKLGETKVTDDGLFRYTPTKAIALIFRANMGAGHVASVTVNKEELPDNLKSDPSGAKDAAQTITTTNAPTPSHSVNSEEFAKIVASAVRKEVQPLRKEIAQYKEKNDLQSILGGIGYILGLTGIVFYIAARRKQAQKS